MGLREYLELLAKRWPIIVIAAVLGCGAGFGASMATTPLYQSKTQLYVSVRTAEGTTGELAQGATYSRQIVNSYVDVVPTGIVLQPVIDSLGLEDSVQSLADKLTVSAPSETALIDIVARDSSPEDAARIAEAVGESFKRVVQEELEPNAVDGQSLVNLTTTQAAKIPSDPFKPKTVENTLIGLLLGLVLGVGAIALRESLDTRIRSVQEAEDVTGLPIMGGIINDPSANQNPLTMQTKPRSPRAESYRSLRTNLQFLDIDGGTSTFVITSANPAEGKSTTSLNLALAIAETGSKVALIEGDLRLPTLHKHLHVEGGAGLTDYLVGRADLEDVLEQWGRTNMFFLPAGRIPPNPSELLGSVQMRELLGTLRREFDTIIIDAPPILSVTDAAVVGDGEAHHLLVIAAGSTRKPEATAAIDALTQAKARIAGLVVTMLPQKALSRYGYGNYGPTTSKDDSE